MKNLLNKVVSSLKSEKSSMVVEEGKVGFGKKLAAWWQGSELVVGSEDKKPKRKVRVRKGKDAKGGGGSGAGGADDGGASGRDGKTAKGRKLSRGSKIPAQAKSRVTGASASGRGGSGGTGSSDLPQARRLSEKEIGSAQKALENDSGPIQNLDDADLLKHLWGASSRTPGGINGAVDIIEPIIRSLSPHQEVLDICAGDGRLMKYLNTYHQAETIGYDVSDSLCNRSGGSVRKFDPDRANFGDERFDFVCATEGLQDIEEKAQVFKAAADAMKVGGKMVFVDGITHSTKGHAPYMARHDGFLAPVLSARFYKKILAENGLKIIGSKNVTKDYCNRITAGWAKAMEVFKNRPMDADSKAFLNEQATHHFQRLQVLQEQEAKMLRIEVTK